MLMVIESLMQCPQVLLQIATFPTTIIKVHSKTEIAHK